LEQETEEELKKFDMRMKSYISDPGVGRKRVHAKKCGCL
jgi:hypothetical protein